MKTKQAAPKNIDEYIAGYPDDVREILEKIRQTIKLAAPGAEETISYLMPTFNLKGNYLVTFAAFKKHIGLYPAPLGNAEFRKELSVYRSSKSTVKLPLDQPIPYDLIARMVKFRARENLNKSTTKGKKKS